MADTNMATPYWPMQICVKYSLRSKRFRGAKSEERGFRCFARARNGARAKKEGGGGEGKEGNACRQALGSLSKPRRRRQRERH